MFSAETTVGLFPVRVVETAKKIIKKTEESKFNDRPLKKVGQFAKMIVGLRRKEKTKVHKVEVENLKDALSIASLRQEDIVVKIDSYNRNYKRKGALVWGVK